MYKQNNIDFVGQVVGKLLQVVRCSTCLLEGVYKYLAPQYIDNEKYLEQLNRSLDLWHDKWIYLIGLLGEKKWSRDKYSFLGKAQHNVISHSSFAGCRRGHIFIQGVRILVHTLRPWRNFYSFFVIPCPASILLAAGLGLITIKSLWSYVNIVPNWGGVEQSNTFPRPSMGR